LIDKIIHNNAYFHFCHKNKSWMAFRFHINACPFCGYKNPNGNPKTKPISLITTYEGTPVIAFEDQYEAIDYASKHHADNIMLTDLGYVPR